jgi:hypothetical protein
MTVSIEVLRRIMKDIEVSVKRRIKMAESLLLYECPEAVVAEARTFLEEISLNQDLHVDLQSAAAEVLRKAEAHKAAPPPATPNIGVNFANIPAVRLRARRLAQRKAAYERRKKFEAAGLWPAPPGWDSDIFSDDWIEPEIDYRLPAGAGLADQLGAARQEFLRGVEEGWANDPADDKERR